MIRLLYVDDNPESCTLVAAFCDRVGSCTVEVLGSGEAALAWLSRSTIDVIVSDYRMPGGMNGITLLKELHTRGISTPFILFTAEDSPELREEAYRNGAASVVSKVPKGRSTLYPLLRAIYWAAGRTVPEERRTA
jgi:CheY-like chemotaxis protein